MHKQIHKTFNQMKILQRRLIQKKSQQCKRQLTVNHNLKLLLLKVDVKANEAQVTIAHSFFFFKQWHCKKL